MRDLMSALGQLITYHFKFAEITVKDSLKNNAKKRYNFNYNKRMQEM